MSAEQITQLPTVETASLTDIIYAVQGYVSPSNIGISVQESLQQVFNLFLSQAILNYAGNPNGNVAANTYQLLWDSSNNLIWICTTSGSAGTAVWKTAFGTFTDGQTVIGSTSGVPKPQVLTAGTNISIDNTSNNITISATGLVGIGWNNVSGTTQSMNADNGYVVSNSSLVTLTLPATAAFGTLIYIQGTGTGLFTIAQNTGQQIAVGSHKTTSGTGGSVTSTNQYDSICLLCVTANTLWTSLTGTQGNFTIV